MKYENKVGDICHVTINAGIVSCRQWILMKLAMLVEKHLPAFLWTQWHKVAFRVTFVGLLSVVESEKVLLLLLLPPPTPTPTTTIATTNYYYYS
jgi:hypothetical protein